MRQAFSLSKVRVSDKETQLLDILKRHLVLSLAFVAAFVITVIFLFKFTMSIMIWSDAGRVDQPIEAWMTPRYVSRSWQVPPEAIAGALGVPADGTGRRVTLAQLAEIQSRDLQALINDLEASIAKFKAGDDD
jgi:hypothetical protein